MNLKSISDILVIFWDKIKVNNAKTATLIITITGVIWTILSIGLNTEMVTSNLSESLIKVLKTLFDVLSFLIAALTVPRTSQDLLKIKTDKLKLINPKYIKLQDKKAMRDINQELKDWENEKERIAVEKMNRTLGLKYDSLLPPNELIVRSNSPLENITYKVSTPLKAFANLPKEAKEVKEVKDIKESKKHKRFKNKQKNDINK